MSKKAEKPDENLNKEFDRKIDKKTIKTDRKTIKKVKIDLSNRKPEIVKQDIYINKVKSRSFPKWLIPMILVIALSLALIWLVPVLFTKHQMQKEARNDSEQIEIDPFLQEANAVLNQRSVAIWAEPNRQSLRITSGVYNEPVKILDSEIKTDII